MNDSLASGSSYDYYSFSTNAYGMVILDIDFGDGGVGALDTEIAIWNADTGILIAHNDDSNIGLGANGSITRKDSYLSVEVSIGNYIVGVAEWQSVALDGGWTGNMVDEDDTYQLNISANVSLSPVPEPTTVALLGIGIVGLVGAGYRKRRKNKQAEKC
ncbi:MAG: DVUA0089 family protein [Candidatus Anammoxibacter sp.]